MPGSDVRTSGRSRQMAYTAAGMYGGAGFLILVECALPGGPPTEGWAGIVALVVLAPLIALGGRGLPEQVIGLLAPLGVLVIAGTFYQSTQPGDSATIYIWPA